MELVEDSSQPFPVAKMVREVQDWTFDVLAIQTAFVQLRIPSCQDADEFTGGYAMETFKCSLRIGDFESPHLLQGKVAARWEQVQASGQSRRQNVLGNVLGCSVKRQAS